MHARTTSSAPNLAITNDDDDDDNDGNALKRRSEAIPLRNEGPSAALPEAPTRSLSLKARGKLPEQAGAAEAAQEPSRSQEPETQPNGRAGDFEEDTTSSRDVSDAEPTPTPPRAQPPPSMGVPLASGRSSVASLPRPDLGSIPTQGSTRRTSLDPLLQPLYYGRQLPSLT